MTSDGDLTLAEIAITALAALAGVLDDLDDAQLARVFADVIVRLGEPAPLTRAVDCRGDAAAAQDRSPAH